MGSLAASSACTKPAGLLRSCLALALIACMVSSIQRIIYSSQGMRTWQGAKYSLKKGSTLLRCSLYSHDLLLARE